MRTARTNVAVVVLDNRPRRMAGVGGIGQTTSTPEHGGAINGRSSPRQPGSALKPFTYALAFEQGLHAGDACCPTSRRTFRPPSRASSTARATTTAGTAARCSRAARSPDPRTCRRSRSPPSVGVRTLLRFLRAAGFTTFDRNASYYGLGLTLGNAEVRLDELVAAYATFARGGVWREPTVRLPSRCGRAQRSVDTLVSRRGPRSGSPTSSADAEARAFIFGRGGNLEFPFPVAVKTGTSQAYHDNWTIGYHARRHGRRLGRQLRSHAAARLLRRHRRRPDLPRRDARRRARVPASRWPPHEIASSPGRRTFEEVTICALSGMRANAWCPSRANEWLPRRRGTAAVLLAPPERRRLADDLSTGIPRMGLDDW